MSAVELLRDNPTPDYEAIREAIGGNICRCTGYQTIIASIERAVEINQSRDQQPEARS